MKRYLIVVLVLSLLLLTGCRTRTTSPASLPGQGTQTGTDAAEGTSQTAGNGQADSVTADGPQEADPKTTQDPDAQRREYDEQAASQVSTLAQHTIHAPGEEETLPGQAADTEAAVDRTDEQGTRTASMTIPAEAADRMGTAEDAEAAATQLMYYSVLLEERVGSLFECRRKELYWEGRQELHTVFKTWPEHQLILRAGCYDVSSRLLEENLTVDAGWVRRKNPGVIVKIVDRSVLGSGVADAGGAEKVWARLAARPGWDGIDAVRNRRIVLISEQLLTSQRLQTAALLYIAKTASPDVFADVDPAEALRALSQEEGGAPAEGLFVYVKE